MRPSGRLAALAAVILVGGSACGSGTAGTETTPTTRPAQVAGASESTEPAEATEATESTAPGAATDEQRFPDVVDAEAERDGTTWTISATLSSPYDTPERYADAWRVVGPDGTVYGERILLHDHAGEQPFTRSQSGIEIPDDVDEVVIEGRDLEYGYGGTTFTLTLPT